MKNILFLEQFSNISGGQRVLLDIIRGLDPSAYRPCVILPASGVLSNELDKIKVKYYFVPLGAYSAGRKNWLDVIRYFIRSLISACYCVKIIRESKTDLIYANAPRTYLFGTIAARLTGTPIIWHLHSILDGLELKSSVRLFKGGVRKMIAVSGAVARPFIEKDSALAAKIEVIYNGVDPDRFRDSSGAEKVRSEIGARPGEKVVAFIGQIASWKGVADFIEAAGAFRAQGTKTVFIIVGDVIFGGSQEQRYRTDILRLAADRGVRYLGRRTDIDDIIKGIDILVLPSIKPDPCPLVVLEAMAAGKPVIATGHGGPAEIITSGVDGVLYPASDVKALTAALAKLLSNPNEALALGAAARQKIIERYSSKIFMKKIKNSMDEAGRGQS